jgi:predicted nucleic acid-binding protein
VRTLVLDTSVAIAWYLPETFATAARSYQKQLLDGRVRFVVPSLHFWEMAKVLRTYVRRRELVLTDGRFFAVPETGRGRRQRSGSAPSAVRARPNT